MAKVISTSGIYVWKENEKPFYVGQSINTISRLKSESEQHQINSLAAAKIESAAKKGTLSYEFYPKPIEELDKWEAYYINKKNTMFPNGLNLQKPKYDLSQIQTIEMKPETLFMKRYGNVGRRIICLDDGNIFSNQCAVAEYYNVNSGSVNHACHHDRDFVEKKMFCYLDDIAVIKSLPRSKVLDIIANFQEDEKEYMFCKTNLKDTIQNLKEFSAWRTEVIITYNSKVYKKMIKW